MRAALVRIRDRYLGRRGHGQVNNIIGQFESQITQLDNAAKNITGEILTNLDQQNELENRNADLQVQRDRAWKVRRKLTEFLS